MSFRVAAFLVVLALLLAACESDGKYDDLQRMQRDHNAALETTA
jgi:hypothetical protein